jgi:penicillin-binding protein 1A
VSTDLKRELGTALGSSCTTLYDLMEVYTAINQYGLRRDLHFIRRVVDRYGNVLEDHTDPGDPTLDFAARLDRAYVKLVAPRRRALDQQTAFLTLSLMKNVVKYGTGIGASKVNEFIAGKTGTTDDSYDAWFMAFTRNLVTGVWVGHDQKERPLGINEQGGRTALPIWVDFMSAALRDYTAKPSKKVEHPDFPPPMGVVKVTIDPDSGLLSRPENARAVDEWYRAGSEPTEFAPDQAILNPDQNGIWDADTPL